MTPTLGYSPPRRRLSGRAARIIVVLAIAFTLPILGWGSLRWYRQWQASRLANAYRVIDADVPGTEVYFNGTRLGVVPVLLSKADCQSLGLPTSPRSSIDSDGWGEGIAIHDPATNADPRLMYRVPDAVASAYLSYETPWGTRTKFGGGRELHNGFRSTPISRGQNGVGVVLDLAFDQKPDPSVRDVQVVATVTNTGTMPYTGYRPEIELLWGTFDVQWAHRAHKTFPVPTAWSNIAPGQVLHATLTIPKPTTAGDYSVFGTLNLFRSSTPGDGYLIGQGSVYSDSKLLRVR